MVRLVPRSMMAAKPRCSLPPFAGDKDAARYRLAGVSGSTGLRLVFLHGRNEGNHGNFGQASGVAFEFAGLAEQNKPACGVTNGEIDAEISSAVRRNPSAHAFQMRSNPLLTVSGIICSMHL